MVVSISLSKLVASRKNPRRVKPERDAHRRLVASIRSHDLLCPLVVRPADGDAKSYTVIAGNRRLAALREVYRDGKDPKIPCVLRKVGKEDARSFALAENFAREGMHPLDEAEEFARLACGDGKSAEAIGAEFGVPEKYIRQRMKLAMLADMVKVAYRKGEIDTTMAETFASVPEGRQEEVWKETGGHPRHAEQVRNIIAHAWIDAKHALFDLSIVSDSAVSRDLFNDNILLERHVFMEAQAQALVAERAKLVEDGWVEAVIAPQAEVQDRLYSMSLPEREFDEETSRKLEKLGKRREKLEAKLGEVEEAGNEKGMQAISEKLDVLDAAESEIATHAPIHFSEETKAMGTAFLILDPDGQVRREFRVPRKAIGNGVNGQGGTGEGVDAPKPKTSDDLSDNQRATTFTHIALSVRDKLLGKRLARKRVLCLIFHEKVRSGALAIRRDANGTTLHADTAEGFASPALDRLRERRKEIDPFLHEHSLDECEAYERLSQLSEKELDALIDLLTVESLTAHLQRTTPLISMLAKELSVDIRECWRPDAPWVASYQKSQLAHLMADLREPAYNPAQEKRKKTELVEALAKLFSDAAEGKLEDKGLAERANRWVPSNLREMEADGGE